MSKWSSYFLAALRIVMGWLFFYAGITKVLNPAWSAAGYLTNAKSFTALYQWFALPQNIGWVNFINEWGLLLLGVSLILGIGVRLSSILGVALMLLYYAPLPFPYPNPHSLIVDEHIVYIAVLLYFAAVRAGRTFGVETWCSNLPICRKFPRLRALLG